MATYSGIIEKLRSLDEKSFGLYPAYPRLAVQIGLGESAAVRLRGGGRKPPSVESHAVEALDEPGVPATMFEAQTPSGPKLAEALRKLYESMGARPGRVSLVLPDNLAKVSLLKLPERPASRRQLDEIVNFKLRRSVPFRMSEASISYQMLPVEEAGASLLVAVVRRSLIEHYERVLESVGARPGLIDLETPNLLNLAWRQLVGEKAEGDAALLNCSEAYFTLAIVRQGKLAFFRCKSYPAGFEGRPETEGLLQREIAGSLSYYEDKLGGAGLGKLIVRSVVVPFETVADRLVELGVKPIEPILPFAAIEPGEAGELDAAEAQRLAPALGAALGRG